MFKSRIFVFLFLFIFLIQFLSCNGQPNATYYAIDDTSIQYLGLGNGASTSLLLDANNSIYLRFNINSSLLSQLRGANLKLFLTQPSSAPYPVHHVQWVTDNGWSENSNWLQRPLPLRSISNVAVENPRWLPNMSAITIDITSLLLWIPTPFTKLSLRISQVSLPSISLNYNSKESGQLSLQPQIELDYLNTGPPLVQQAVFDDNSLSVTVIFNRPTNAPAGQPPPSLCATLFSSATLLSGSNCTWLSDRVLYISIGSSATLILTSQLTFKNVVVNNYTSEATPTQPFSISRPLLPTAPTITLFAPNPVRGCATSVFYVNFQISSGSLNRTYTVVWWVIDQKWQANASNITYLKIQPVQIYPGDLNNVTVNVTNLFGQSTLSTIWVSSQLDTPTEAPVATLNVPSSILASQAFSGSVTPSFTICPSTTSSLVPTYKYQWSITPYINLNSYTLTNTTSISLPVGVLQPGTSYIVQLTLQIVGQSKGYPFNTTLTVKPSSLVLSNIKNVDPTISFSQSTTLSASGSDPDVVNRSAALFTSAYLWSCTPSNTSIAGCGLELKNIILTSPNLTLPVNTFSLSDNYTFTLTYFSAYGTNPLRSVALQTVLQVLAPNNLTVTLNGPTTIDSCTSSVSVSMQVTGMFSYTTFGFYAWRINGIPMPAETASTMIVQTSSLIVGKNLIVGSVVDNFRQTFFGNISVTLLPPPAPQPSITSNSSNVLASDSLFLNSSVSVTLCPNASQKSFQYLWASYPSLSMLSSPPTTSTLTIPPGPLTPGLSYIFELSVATIEDNIWNSTNFTIFVQPSPIHAVITSDQTNVSVMQALLLDGTGSYDPDMMGRSASNFTTGYQWSCFDINLQTSNGNCGLDNQNYELRSSKLSLLPQVIAAGDYLFALTYTSTYFGNPSRTANDSVQITFRPQNTLTVTLSGPSSITQCSTTVSINASIVGAYEQPNITQSIWFVNGADFVTSASPQLSIILPIDKLILGSNLLQLRVWDNYAVLWMGTTTMLLLPPQVEVVVQLFFPLNIMASQSLNGKANIVLISCQPTEIVQYKFTWSSLPSLSIMSSFNISSIFLPPNTLEPGVSYSFQLVAQSIGASWVGTNNITVTVSSTPLSVNIIGGNRTALVTESVTLDGTASVDLDRGDNNWNDFTYGYSWACKVSISNTLMNCNLPQSVSLTQSKLLLPSGTVTLGGIYYFYLTFTSTYSGNPPRNATTFRTITYSLPPPPIQVPVPSFLILGATVINPTGFLRLQGIQTDKVTPISANLLSLWEEIGGHSQILTNNSILTNSPSLIIKPLVLQAGVTYIFQLTVTNVSTGLYSRASSTVYVHLPPFGGACNATLDPAIQTTSVTLPAYILSCQGWQDETVGTTLFYSFSYTIKNTSTIIRISDFSSSSNVSAYLPVGYLVVIGTIQDLAGAATTFSFDLKVVPLEIPVREPTECVVQDVLNSTLAQALALGRPDTVLQLIELLSELLLSDTVPDLNSTLVCNGVSLNQTIAAYRSQLWNIFVNTIASLTQQTHVSPALSQEITSVLITLLENLQATQSSNQSASSIDKETQLIINMLNVIIMDVSSDDIANNQVVLLLSQLLAVVNCSQIDEVVALLSLFSQRTLEGKLPQEAVLEFFTPHISSTGARIYVGQNANLTQGDLSFNFPASMLQQAGFANESAFVEVTIVRFSSAVGRCRVDSQTGKTPDGPVIRVNVTSNGTDVVKTDGEDWRFWLPLDPTKYYQIRSKGCVIEDVLVNPNICYWWNTKNNTWSNQGCQTVGPVEVINGQPQVLCSCNHLTDFAVLLNTQDKDCQTSEATVKLIAAYHFFTYFYTVLAIIAANQFRRLAMAYKSKLFTENLVIQHALIFFVCASRAITSARVANGIHMPAAILGLVTALPYMFVFWIYTLLVFQWAGVFHHAMREKETFAKVQPWFLLLNILVLLVVLMLFISISTNTFTNGGQVALVGSIIMAIITSASGIAFFVYGNLLACTLRSQQTLTSYSASSLGKSGPCDFAIATKMTMLAVTVSCVFLGESFAWVASVQDSKHYDSYTVLFLTLDCVAIIAVMLVFAHAVTRKSNPKPDPFSAAGGAVNRQTSVRNLVTTGTRFRNSNSQDHANDVVTVRSPTKQFQSSQENEFMLPPDPNASPDDNMDVPYDRDRPRGSREISPRLSREASFRLVHQNSGQLLTDRNTPPPIPPYRRALIKSPSKEPQEIEMMTVSWADQVEPPALEKINGSTQEIQSA